MSIEPAAEQNELPKCGRLVFRGVELAYLNIDGEYMLPLAELLALVLPTTPRTTLFTRMEKMKVRRHFCQPEEIKMLKTVNGIHGSSANCTLISKAEVDKYCSMYIDNLNHESTKRKCTEDRLTESKIAIEEQSVANYSSKDMETAYHNNTEIPNKLTVLHKQKGSSPLKAKIKLTKISNGVKLKSAFSADCHCTQTLTGDARLASIDGHLFTSINKEGSIPAVSPELLSSFHSSNFTQTHPLLTNDKLKSTKKRDRNLNSETDKKRRLCRVKKRPSSDVEGKQEFESPLKIPKRSELNAREEESDKLRQFHTFRPHCSSQKQELDTFISDSSSNDSGFVSTTLSNTSSPTSTKADFSAGDLCESQVFGSQHDKKATKKREHSSPRKPPTLKTPTKNKIKEDDGNSLTLSPPALLLKRYEDSWQVEQKKPVKEVTNFSHKSKVKTEDKTHPGGLVSLFEETCGQTKQVRKRRKRRKPLISKEVSPIVQESFDREKPDTGHKISKRKQKAKRISQGERTFSNGQVVGPEKRYDFLTAKGKKSGDLAQEGPTSDCQKNTDKQNEDDPKKRAVLDRIVGDALAKFFGPKTNSLSTSASAANQEPTKPKPKKAKIAGTTKPVLKTNSKFKLLNLFPATSQIGLEDGRLCPVFTMSCPSGFQPPSSHPLWNWRLGGPVFRESSHKFLKPKPISKPKQPQSNSTTKFVANKVRKLRRRRRRKKVPVSNARMIPVSNSFANPAISSSKATENNSGGNSQFKSPICDAFSNNVSSFETTESYSCSSEVS